MFKKGDNVRTTLYFPDSPDAPPLGSESIIEDIHDDKILVYFNKRSYYFSQDQLELIQNKNIIQEPHKCHCDFRDLMMNGCKCEGV